ncbi:transporter [Streptomyces sp. ME01-24h]|nr:transporter [Streptomyces sp. ME19-03-3]MDX3356300.1 transporter [Streptomyces sp. ME01-24h]
MTGTFVRLKLSVLRNGLRQSTGRTVGWIFGTLASLLLALGMVVGLVLLRGNQYAPSVAIGVGVVLGVGWAVMPLFVFGGDDTLDPTRLSMLPLRAWPLVRGLLVSSLVGVGPLVTLLAVAGAAVAVTADAGSVVAAVLAVPLTVLLCVALSRAVAAANTRLLTSRRGRDLAVLSGVLIAVGGQLVNLGVNALASERGLERFSAFTVALRWVPSASALDAVRSAAKGSYGLAVAEIAWTGAVLGLVLVWWHASLDRLMTRPDSSTLQAGPSSVRTARFRVLPEGRTGTVMERQFRYGWRDPRTKAAWATALAVGLLLPLVAAVQHGSVYTACWAAGLLGLQMYNQFGMDGSAFWTVAATISSRADAYAELRGRALAIAVLGVPYVAVVTVGAALTLGRADALAETLGLSFALLGALVATGAWASVRFPYSMPQENRFGSAAAPGQTSLAWLSLVGGALTGAVITLPVLGLLVWLHVSGRHGALWLVLPLGCLYGAAFAVVGVRTAAPRLLGRLPEVLTAVSKG